MIPNNDIKLITTYRFGVWCIKKKNYIFDNIKGIEKTFCVNIVYINNDIII